MAEFGAKKARKKRPAFGGPDASLNAWADLAEPATPNVETDSAAELSALQVAFKGRRGAEDRRFRDATDSEFWFAMCFRTRDDKERFLKALNLTQLGDKYLDGHKVAQVLGVDLD